MLTTQVGFIGAGRMATALGRGLVKAELVSSSAIVACDPSPAAAERFESAIPGATVLENNCQLAAEVGVVVLAVKPQHMDLVLAELADGAERANGGIGDPLVCLGRCGRASGPVGGGPARRDTARAGSCRTRPA